MSNMKKRIDWIDFAKGLTMILVIVGHCVGGNEVGERVRGVIFSFHMPLFFVLSCVTYRYSVSDSDFLDHMKRAAKHLLIPAYLVNAVFVIADVAKNLENAANIDYWRSVLYTAIFASGLTIPYGPFIIYTFGIPWFLVALFCGRTIFDYVQLKFDDKQVVVIVWILSMCGVILGKTQYLPFSLDIALAIMPFFLMGKMIKGYDLTQHALKKLIVSFVVWICGLLIVYPNVADSTYLEFTFRRYDFYPLCYLVAAAGIIFVSEISFFLSKMTHVSLPVRYMGKNSLYLLIAHLVDLFVSKIWTVEGRQFVTCAKRIFVDLLIFAVIMVWVELYRKILKPRFIDKGKIDA